MVLLHNGGFCKGCNHKTLLSELNKDVSYNDLVSQLLQDKKEKQ
jgi:hypothetical protein